MAGLYDKMMEDRRRILSRAANCGFCSECPFFDPDKELEGISHNQKEFRLNCRNQVYCANAIRMFLQNLLNELNRN